MTEVDGSRRTFVIRVDGGETVLFEDVRNGERVRLDGIASVGDELGRRLGSPSDRTRAAKPTGRTTDERP